MNNFGRVTVNYDVQVNIGGLSLLLFSIFSPGRSVHEVLFGRGGEWGPPAQLEPWLEMESSPFSGLLGGKAKWGTEVDSINWE